MLVKLFKSTQPIVYIILPILVLAVWLAAFFISFSVITEQDAPLYDLLVNELGNANKYVFVVLSILLIIFQSFYLAYVVDKHELLNKRGYLPAVVYALLIIIIPHSFSFHPILIVNTFYIWILDRIFTLYKSPSPIAVSFDIGLICALATLFYLPSTFMLLIFIIAVNMLRPFAWRNVVSSLIGFMAICFLAWLIYFLTDSADRLNLLMGSFSVSQGKDFTDENFLFYIISFSVLILLVTISVTDMILRYYSNTSRLRRFSQVVWIYCLIALLVTPFIFKGLAYQLTLLIIPFTILVSHLLSRINKKNLDELLFYLLIGLALSQFFI